MKSMLEGTSVFLAGGVLYSLIEIAWRGYTHWSMIAAGGLCFLLLYGMNRRFAHVRLPVRCLMGAAVITGIEFLVGLVVNLALGLDVWDYSGMPFNLLGQVCLLFSCLWFLLCIPAFLFSTVIRRFFLTIEW